MKIYKKHILYLCILLSNTSVAIELVDVELQLLIDISGSVNNSEYQLQMQGYQAAFQSSSVQNAIINGDYGKAAVQLIMWSGENQQEIMIDWTLIDSIDASNNFATSISQLARPFSGWTAIGEAINYGYQQFDTNNFEGFVKVIDVSGDGTNNQGIAPEQARDNAIDNGIDNINGIVITTNQAVIDQYSTSVVTGDESFLLASATFGDFEQGIETKLAHEIQSLVPVENVIVTVPEPSSLYLFLIALTFPFFKKFTRRSSL